MLAKLSHYTLAFRQAALEDSVVTCNPSGVLQIYERGSYFHIPANNEITTLSCWAGISDKSLGNILLVLRDWKQANLFSLLTTQWLGTTLKFLTLTFYATVRPSLTFIYPVLAGIYSSCLGKLHKAKRTRRPPEARWPLLGLSWALLNGGSFLCRCERLRSASTVVKGVGAT